MFISDRVIIRLIKTFENRLSCISTFINIEFIVFIIKY
jgi:hypothetical protein